MNNPTSLDRAKRGLVNAGTLVAGGLGLYGLGVWHSGNWDLMAYGSDTIPMAPGTALLLVLLSAAVGLRHRWAARPVVRALEFSVVGIVALASAAVCLQNLAGLNLRWEHWLAHTEATVQGIPVGHMSPLTAAVFLGAVFSLLVLFPPMAEKTWLRRAGTLVAFLGGCYSVTVALAYATGTPLFYGGTTVPMAFLTAIALAALNLALLAEGGVDAMWRTVNFIDFPVALRPRFSPAAWRLAIVAAVAMAGILLTGTVFLRSQQAVLRERIAQELAAVADLKVKQIVDWRSERLSDASFLMRAPFVAKDVAAYFAQPDSAASHADVTRWLDLMKGGERYETVALFDAEPRVRLVLPEGNDRSDPTTREGVQTALRTNRVFASELHATGAGNEIHLDLFAPVFRPGGQPGGESQSSGRPFAVILLEIDPRDFLYPLIQTWPMPSETAETLLVRREGDEIVFLNELRHQAGTALKLRRSIDEPQLPAAMGVRGEIGAREGIDYRGVPVLAVTRVIPNTAAGSPWLLVAKVDQAEIYAPLRWQAWTVGAVVAALLLAAAAAAGMFWRQHAARYLHRELVAERERKALAERLALVMRHANDIILLLDDQWRIVEANDRAVEAYGYTLDELRQKTIVALRPSETRAEFPAQSNRLLAEGSVVFETVHQRKDGTSFPVEVSSRLVRLESESYRLSIIRDIAQRQAHEREIERMNRLYAALSQVNKVVVRVTSRQELFDEVCRVMVESGRFQLAWIGELDAARHVIHPVARAGSEQGGRFLEELRISTETGAADQGPTGTAVREGRGDVCNDYAADPRITSSWRAAAQRAGFNAAAAFPIRFRREVWGNLTVNSAEAGFFRDKEIALLEETAADISFALDRLEDLAERRRMLQELQAREADLARTQATAHLGNWSWDIPNDLLTGSDELYRIYGVTPAAFDRKMASMLKLVHPDDQAKAREVLAAVGRGENVESFENRIRRPDGGERVVLAQGASIELDANGAPRRYFGVMSDITERKRAEAALRESEERFRTLFATMSEMVALHELVCDAAGRAVDYRILDCNPAFTVNTGIAREQAVEALASVLYGVEPAPFLAEYARVAQTGEPHSFETHFAPMGKYFSISVFSPGPGRFGTVTVDITERKGAEAALRESEERFRRVVDAAPEAIFIQTEGRLAYVNPAAVRIYGADSAGQLVGQSMLDRVHPYFREAVGERMRLLREQGQTVPPMEQVHLRLDGQPVAVFVAAVSFVHEGKNGALVFATDISERKRADEALRLSQLKFETFFRSAPDLNSISELESGKIVEANELFCDLFGSRETVIGRSMADLNLWQTEEDRLGFIKSLRDGAGKVRNFAACLRLGSGETRDFLLSGQIVAIEGQEYVLMIGRDITEIRQSARERALLTNALAASLNEIYLFDAETWRFLFVNDSALHNLGYALPQMLWMTPLDLLPDTDRATFEQAVGLLIRHEKPALVLESRSRRADGSFYPVEVHVQLFESESGRAFLAVIQDITDRQRAEAALRESQALYHSFIEQLPSGVFRKDAAGRYVMVNSQFCRLKGGIAEEFLGKSPREVAGNGSTRQDESGQATKYAGEGEGAHEQIMRTGQIIESEEEYLDATGGKQFLHVVRMPVFGPDGKVIGTQGIQFDITERKLAEQKLQESEYFLRKSQEVSRLGSFQYEVATGTWTCSPILEEIFGIDARYPRDTNGWLEIVVPEQRQELDQYLKQHVVAEHNRFEKEYRIVRLSDRQERWVFGLGELEFDEHGHTLRMIGTIQDITERRAAASALQNAKEFAENLIRTANTIIVWLDADGRIMLFNEAAEQITGYTRAELEGKNWFEVLVPRARYPQVWTEFARLLNGGEPVRFENPILTKAGEERFIAWQNSDVHEQGRIVGTISFGMDITDRRRAEAEVRQLNVELEQRVRERTAALEATNNELEAFSYSVSHDLRAPLRAIDGFTRILLEDHAKALDTEGRRVLDVISKEGQRMGQLIDDLLAFSRLGRRALQPVEVDLTALARKVFNELAEHEPKRRLKLRLPALPPAHADPSLIRQVLVNLLGNAIKYTRLRTVGEIEIGGTVQGSENVYFIKDNGAGFDMQYADKLFGVFQRLHREEEFEGTGVGLALVQQIVRRHGGRVWAEAKVDHGATFFFTLPVHSK